MLGLFTAVLLVLLPASGRACSRILYKQEGLPAFSARTMDWGFSFEDYLLISPRGRCMDGGLGDQGHSARWTAKYGSVVSSVNGWLSTMFSSRTGAKFDFEKDGASDGINEKGLAAHLLYLEATKYAEDSEESRAGVSYLRWVRYLLDTCASVEEAMEAMRHVRVADVF